VTELCPFFFFFFFTAAQLFAGTCPISLRDDSHHRHHGHSHSLRNARRPQQAILRLASIGGISACRGRPDLPHPTLSQFHRHINADYHHHHDLSTVSGVSAGLEPLTTSRRGEAVFWALDEV